MKTVFDKTTREELISRISSLNENSTAQWGKMNVNQMVKHCVIADEMFLGKKQYKRLFIGRVIGRIALKSMMKDEALMGKNAPTRAEFIVTEVGGDLTSDKKRWTGFIEEYADFSNPDFEHWFFGKMTKEQVGYMVYKHNDHHLRQFNS